MIRFTVASYVINQNTATANIHGRESASKSGPVWMQLAVPFAEFLCLSAFEVPLEIVTLAVWTAALTTISCSKYSKYPVQARTHSSAPEGR